ncbi:lymphocyte activation gene 3 protein [Genypterus blacodes]|uniref:lymphocyte activation gene 3 protein n=1 Tax=Genypterus blacodes TaxID=154954 RepID=UPI003F769984
MWEYLIFGVISSLITGAQCEITEVIAESGSEAVLPCECHPPSKSAPFVLWSKEGRGTVLRKERSGMRFWGHAWMQHGTQRAHSPQAEFTRGEYNLHIRDVRDDDAGVYTCKVQDRTHSVQKTVMLRVIKVSISSSPSLSGNKVSIRCNVTPWPELATTQWALNGAPFRPQAEMKVITSNRDTASVVQGKATERLAGNWTCDVSYKGTQGRATAPLSVRGIVHPNTDDTRVYAAVGSALTLPCVFSSGLIPTDPLWERLSTGSLSKPAPHLLPPSFAPSIVSSNHPWDKSANLTEVRSEDGGRYRCSAKVEGIRLTRSMQLIVAKIISNIRSNKRSPAKLTCHLSDPKEITGYEWVHVTYDLNGTQIVRSIQKGKELVVDMMTGDNLGEWVCRFHGKKGSLGNVTSELQVMSRLTGDGSSGLSHNTATVIGLFFLLLVLLVVLVQIYKNYQRRKKIFQFPALETIVHTISNEREARERHQVKK